MDRKCIYKVKLHFPHFYYILCNIYMLRNEGQFINCFQHVQTYIIVIVHHGRGIENKWYLVPVIVSVLLVSDSFITRIVIQRCKVSWNRSVVGSKQGDIPSYTKNIQLRTTYWFEEVDFTNCHSPERKFGTDWRNGVIKPLYINLRRVRFRRTIVFRLYWVFIIFCNGTI